MIFLFFIGNVCLYEQATVMKVTVMFNHWLLTTFTPAYFPTNCNATENTLITKAANPAAFKFLSDGV